MLRVLSVDAAHAWLRRVAVTLVTITGGVLMVPALVTARAGLTSEDRMKVWLTTQGTAAGTRGAIRIKDGMDTHK